MANGNRVFFRSCYSEPPIFMFKVFCENGHGGDFIRVDELGNGGLWVWMQVHNLKCKVCSGEMNG